MSICDSIVKSKLTILDSFSLCYKMGYVDFAVMSHKFIFPVRGNNVVNNSCIWNTVVSYFGYIFALVILDSVLSLFSDRNSLLSATLTNSFLLMNGLCC